MCPVPVLGGRAFLSHGPGVSYLKSTALVFKMPNEGHLGGFAIRRFIQRFMMIGFAISIGVHVSAIGTYYLAVRLAGPNEAVPVRVIYFDPSNLGPPPALSGDEAVPGSFGGEYKLKGKGKPELPPEEDLDAALKLAGDVVPTFELTPGIGSQGGGGTGFGEGGGTGRGGGGSGGAATLGKYSPPVPVVIMWPSYPSSAQRRGVKGTVIVRVHVTADGIVDRAEVVSGIEDQACRAAALQAAMKLRFLPALLGNKPVDAWFSYPVEFGKKR
jgi:TonB family protein